MRRLSHIAFAALLAAMCVLPAAGQNYKASKVREKSEPEPLEFRKVYCLPSNGRKEIRTALMRWEYHDFDMDLNGFPVGSDGNYMSMNVNGLDVNGIDGRIYGRVGIVITEGLVVLQLDNIHACWREHDVKMSRMDDRFNRPWLWRVNHNPEVVQAARERCKEIFDTLCASMDEFLKDGPPMEMRRLN